MQPLSHCADWALHMGRSCHRDYAVTRVAYWNMRWIRYLDLVRGIA